MDKYAIICQILELLTKNLKIPVSVKIRVWDNKCESLGYLSMLLKRNISFICIHGRTREQKRDKKGVADIDKLKYLTTHATVPVIQNGNISNSYDALFNLKIISCDAVMSAEALMEYPCLFGELNMSDDLKQYVESNISNNEY